MRRKSGKGAGDLMISLGAVLLLGALGLFLYNRSVDKQAGESAAVILQQLTAAQNDNTANGWETNTDKGNSLSSLLYQIDPNVEMPAVYVGENAYVGTITIPALGLELPVLQTWDNTLSRGAPCRYAGSVYRGDLVIAAHNYTAHFGRIHTLSAGENVRFTDTDGHVFSYTVAAVEVLSSDSVSAMCRSEWPLTLFTCTYGGQYRVTVRCALSG